MELAKAKIAEALQGAQAPVVLSSWGKDSALLLNLVHAIAPLTPVLWFRLGTNQSFARAQILELQKRLVPVVSYPPAAIYALQDVETTLIAEYSFGPDRLPMAVDLVPGTACSLELQDQLLESIYQPWDLILTGYKDCDTHWLKGSNQLFPETLKLGLARVVAPLRHLTDSQVLSELSARNIAFDSTDSLPTCSACYSSTEQTVHCPKLNGPVPVQHWDRPTALNNFQRRFHLAC